MKIMKAIIGIFCFVLVSSMAQAQNVGIGTTTPDASAILDLRSTTKGVLLPRLTAAQVNAIPNPAKGLMVFNETVNQVWVNTGTPGAPLWQVVSANNAWGLSGNAGINVSDNFIGTTDNNPLFFRFNNNRSGFLNATQTTFGNGAGVFPSLANSIVAIGDSALHKNLTGDGMNTALGSKAG